MVAPMYEHRSDTAPVRRRIVPQPLRTEAPFALIAGDALPTEELEERLKRGHPLITFPSLSHFLADPPRREPWAAIIVARSGAWDPRLDSYVRRRSRIALFGLTEESYGWPQAVARVRDLAELEPWLEALNAPESTRKEPVKRSRRLHAQLALSGLTSDTTKHEARPPEAPPAATAPAQDAPQPLAAAPEAVAAPPASSARPPAGETAAARPERTIRKPQSRKNAVSRPTPPARPERRARPAATADAHADITTDTAFTRLAMELGLTRAYELLDKLRKRAAQLVSTMSKG
jgi:hypothetical protein